MVEYRRARGEGISVREGTLRQAGRAADTFDVVPRGRRSREACLAVLCRRRAQFVAGLVALAAGAAPVVAWAVASGPTPATAAKIVLTQSDVSGVLHEHLVP